MRGLVAITHVPSPAMEQCQLTHKERAPIDLALARRQHADYCAKLERYARVVTLTANRDLPDAVFVEDTAVVLDEVAILARMGAPSRRAEPAGIEPELRKYREIIPLQAPATLDGGDVFLAGKTIFVGLSARTNAAGASSFAEAVRRYGYQVRTVPIRDCLHLKSACTPLPDQSLLVNPAWLELSALDGFKWTAVDPGEPWAADVLSIGETVWVAAGQDRTAELIRRRGFKVETVELSEFAKAEGAVTCLSLIFKAA